MRITFILGLLMTAFFLTHCDSREDYFELINASPEIILTRETDTITTGYADSLKIGQSLTLSYKVIDELDSLDLHYQVSKGEDQPVEISDNTISITGETESETEILFYAVDEYGESASQVVTLNVFKNLVPVANFTIDHIATVSRYEIELDASTSYDQDEKFGGSVTRYEYTLGTYTFQSTLPVIRYIFGSGGQKKIGVRVRDNDGVWSEEKWVYFVMEELRRGGEVCRAKGVPIMIGRRRARSRVHGCRETGERETGNVREC